MIGQGRGRGWGRRWPRTRELSLSSSHAADCLRLLPAACCRLIFNDQWSRVDLMFQGCCSSSGKERGERAWQVSATSESELCSRKVSCAVIAKCFASEFYLHFPWAAQNSQDAPWTARVRCLYSPSLILSLSAPLSRTLCLCLSLSHLLSDWIRMRVSFHLKAFHFCLPAAFCFLLRLPSPSTLFSNSATPLLPLHPPPIAGIMKCTNLLKSWISVSMSSFSGTHIRPAPLPQPLPEIECVCACCVCVCQS